MTLSRMIYKKTRWTLKAYCEMRGIAYYGLQKGYISKKNALILDRDGIAWREADNVYISGGTCASRRRVDNKMREGLENNLEECKRLLEEMHKNEEISAGKKVSALKEMPKCPLCKTRPVLFEFLGTDYKSEGYLYKCECNMALQKCDSISHAERQYHSAQSNLVKSTK